jgi:hypothetical protein
MSPGAVIQHVDQERALNGLTRELAEAFGQAPDPDVSLASIAKSESAVSEL